MSGWMDKAMDELRPWIGRVRTVEDDIGMMAVRRVAATFDVVLYDLTSTYFECAPPEESDGLRRFGYSRDKRSDCVQVVIALIVLSLPLWRAQVGRLRRSLGKDVED